MTLTLYNTLTRRKEPFETLEPGKVKMYCCGVTVYDYCHLGHARAYIVWDTVRRYLLWRGYEVRYVQNFTDIDDKILNRARETGSSMEAVSSRFIEEYFKDMDRLNILRADEYPRATHSLDGIKRLIHELEHKGYAYASAGDVYYPVRQFSEYGKLSGKRLDDLQAGKSGRVEVEDADAAKKKDPFDFVLWKSAKEGEPAWESDWGKGRPGWHIECSAMVRDRLGETIDIHCGGNDLEFPHHENEIAQSEAATGKSLSRYWMHNGMVTVDGKKMSKSLGNFTTIRDMLERRTDASVVRLFVLFADYRKPLDFTDLAIASAKNSWDTLKGGLLFGYQYGAKLGWEHSPGLPLLKGDGKAIAKRESKSQNPHVDRFQAAMDDDFNTPSALAVLFELAKELSREGNILVHQGKTETPPLILQQQWQTLVSLASVLGLEALPEEEIADDGGISDAEIEALIQNRQDARKAKNYAEGDRIRQELQTQGIILIDTPEGTRWERQKK